jgi:ABC-type transport system involved in multi-copper enzyme maturation permease subunit
MTTPMMPPPPPAYPPSAAPTRFSLDVTGTAPVPLWRLVAAEFRKSYDTRAGMWLLIAIGILVSIVELFVLVITLIKDTEVYFSDFAFIVGGVSSILLPVLGIMLVTSEWGQRSAMVTFALEPRRARVVLAKWVVAVAWVLVTVAVMLVVAVLLTTIASIANPDTTHWSGSAGDNPHLVPFVVVQMLNMTIGFALGALLLNTPGAIVLFFAYTWVLPGVLAAIGLIKDWIANALEWVNFQLAVQPFVDGSISTGEEWGKILVSGLIWIGIPLGFGIWRILRAEVK